MKLSKFFESYSMKTSFSQKFTELLDKGSESILQEQPLPNILHHIQKQFSKHIDLSTSTLKTLSFTGSELLTKAESWILLLYYFLKTSYDKQEAFLSLLQQLAMFRVTGKHKLKRFVLKCCKQYFTKAEAICIINSNPANTTKISQNASDSLVESKFNYFIYNQNFFDEKTSHTTINIINKGTIYNEGFNKKEKVSSTSASEPSFDDSDDEIMDDDEKQQENKIPKIRSVKLRKKIEKMDSLKKKQQSPVSISGVKRKRGRPPKNSYQTIEKPSKENSHSLSPTPVNDEINNNNNNNQFSITNETNIIATSFNNTENVINTNESQPIQTTTNNETSIPELKPTHVITHSEMCINNTVKEEEEESDNDRIINLLKTAEMS